MLDTNAKSRVLDELAFMFFSGALRPVEQPETEEATLEGDEQDDVGD